MVGAIILSPTDAASQEKLDRLGAACRSGTHGLHVTHAYNIISSTSALISQILSSRGALGWSYSPIMYFRKLYHALRMHRSTSMDPSALWLTVPARHTK